MVEEARENPNGEKGFPWGAAIGLGVAGVIAAVVIIKWDDIVAAINPPPVVIKKTIATQQSYYQPPANTQTSSQTSVSETTTTTTKTPTQTKYPEPTPQPAPVTPFLKEATKGKMGGVITDSSNYRPISGATVTIKNATTGATQKIKTDSKGKFVMTADFGDYDVTYEAPCYQTDPPLRFSLTKTVFPYENSDPYDISAGLVANPYETFSYKGDLPANDNGISFTFCKPRKVSQVKAEADAYAHYNYWAGLKGWLIKADGTLVDIGEYVLHENLGNVFGGADNRARIAIGGAQASDGSYLDSLGEFKGIRIRRTYDGDVYNASIRVSFA